MQKDIVNVAVVNFESVWGDKEKNLNRILGYTECAAKRGADIVVFPELALTDYAGDTENSGENMMHRRLAETLPGPSSEAVAELTRRYGIYVIYGLAERDGDKVYNAAAVVGPDGLIGSSRKMHLPWSEAEWAERGDKPFYFESPWGPIGVGICYDTYAFGEVMRYFRALGCRLYLNPTAVDTNVTAQNVKDAVEYLSANNCIYIASANLTGAATANDMIGGSNIIGPSKNAPAVHYYAGQAFGSPGSDEQEMYLGTLDLSYVNKSFLSKQWKENDPDFRPELYIDMYRQIQEKFNRKEK